MKFNKTLNYKGEDVIVHLDGDYGMVSYRFMLLATNENRVVAHCVARIEDRKHGIVIMHEANQDLINWLKKNKVLKAFGVKLENGYSKEIINLDDFILWK